MAANLRPGLDPGTEGFNGSPWTFTNTATGKFITDAHVQAIGVYAPNGGLIVNHGLMETDTTLNVGFGTNSQHGSPTAIDFFNGAGEVDNYGVITATSAGPDH